MTETEAIGSESCARTMVILVTGATGFVGHTVVARGTEDPALHIRASVRHPSQAAALSGDAVAVGDISADTDWREALRGVDAIIHTAARVHVMRDEVSDPLAEFRRTNVAGTLHLARQAANAGVRRFVFLSSIKVNGERTMPGHPYIADDPPAPVDPYAISKYEAEQGLYQLSRETGLEVVIIRPVLVYGPGVGANFLAMMRWATRGIPLPLGAIHNQRSLVAVENLADLALLCARHPAAAGHTFLVSDGEDLSTTALLQRIAAASGVRASLIPVPVAILRAVARVVGKQDYVRRLCDSLQVDIRKTQQLLGWTPTVSVDAALKRTADHLLQSKA